MPAVMSPIEIEEVVQDAHGILATLFMSKFEDLQIGRERAAKILTLIKWVTSLESNQRFTDWTVRTRSGRAARRKGIPHNLCSEVHFRQSASRPSL